jgi:hypothetical protein
MDEDRIIRLNSDPGLIPANVDKAHCNHIAGWRGDDDPLVSFP